MPDVYVRVRFNLASRVHVRPSGYGGPPPLNANSFCPTMCCLQDRTYIVLIHARRTIQAAARRAVVVTQSIFCTYARPGPREVVL